MSNIRDQVEVDKSTGAYSRSPTHDKVAFQQKIVDHKDSFKERKKKNIRRRNCEVIHTP